MRLYWLSAICLMANCAFAAPTAPVDGAEYISLETPQPTATSGKPIEVIEFFMYHCPACNLFDEPLANWVKKQGDAIVFKRIHVARKGVKDAEAHLWLTLQALQKEEALHSTVLHTWHVAHQALKTDEQNIEWAQKNGLDKETFVKTYNSFAVLSKLADLPRIARNYQVDSTPTLIIDGRYQTSMGLVSDSNKKISVADLPKATLQVMDALVEKAQAARRSYQ